MKKIIIKLIQTGLLSTLFLSCGTTENEIIEFPQFKGKVVFIRLYFLHGGQEHYELIVMDLDGSNKKIIDTSTTLSIRDPNWSKDGKKIIYIANGSKEGGTVAIYDLERNERQFIKQADGSFITNSITPRFSPGSDLFAFASVASNSSYYMVYSIGQKAVIRAIKELTYYSYSPDFKFLGSKPWNQNGDKIAVTGINRVRNRHGLYLVSINNGKIEPIIEDTNTNVQDTTYFTFPIWGLDDKKIIYKTAYRSIYNIPARSKLYMIDVENKGKNEIIMDSETIPIEKPKYLTKDRNYLLFTSGTSIIAVDLTTGKTRYLLQNVSYDLDISLEK